MVLFQYIIHFERMIELENDEESYTKNRSLLLGLFSRKLLTSKKKSHDRTICKDHITHKLTRKRFDSNTLYSSKQKSHDDNVSKGHIVNHKILRRFCSSTLLASLETQQLIMSSKFVGKTNNFYQGFTEVYYEL